MPAKFAKIGIVDKIFSRIGASDDLAHGRSTFMVEMVETAVILNQATSKSLVILDEIGRGTATYDGLSIAWAVLEHLHDKNKARALFATHYHELTVLSETLKNLSLYTIKVKEWEGNIVFLHEIIEGVADRSYGIHVAKIAGMPKPAITRANIILKQLENKDTKTTSLPLFAVSNTVEDNKFKDFYDKNKDLIEDVKKINPDNLSPREALDYLYKIKGKIS
ncbi:MAG: DNA mismatch repair protein MutS [Alphaproteobacteria bacterium ADurb.Bin438]|nr:MAG: DNA mismatch repair protein MutS [Alphaproteobacteria bacterium ADurb.Bin438]